MDNNTEVVNKRCKINWHYDCFLFRLIWAIGVFVIIFGMLIASIIFIDKLDIARRCLEYCAPYAGSVPWILVIVCVTLLLCIPDVTEIISILTKRIKSIGTIEFSPMKDDPDVRKEAEDAVGLGDNGQISSESREKQVAQKAKEIKDLKRKIVKVHEEEIQALLMDYDIGIRERDLFFDARYKDGLKRIAVKVFPISSKTIESFCLEFEELREQYKADNFSLHILIYHQHGFSANEWRKEVARIMRISNRIDCVKPYFYSVAKDMSVSPVENVA